MGAFDVVGVFVYFVFTICTKITAIQPLLSFDQSVAVENIENPFGYPSPCHKFKSTT